MIRTVSFFLIFFIVISAGCKSDPASTAKTVDNNVATDVSIKKDVPAPKPIPEPIPETAKVISEEKAEVAAPVEQPVKRKPKPKPRKVEQMKEVVATTAPKPKKKKVVAPAPAAAQARVHFWETVHEFGEIDEGDKITAKFKFTNTGKAPLTIDDVSVSCGCTMPTYPIIPIGPGENGEIGVIYDSKGKFGTQKPTLTVKTNAVEPLTKLYLSGSIKHVFEKVNEDTTTEEPDSTSIKG